eukprot:3674378-Pyramimonas_sp.AAC.1
MTYDLRAFCYKATGIRRPSQPTRFRHQSNKGGGKNAPILPCFMSDRNRKGAQVDISAIARHLTGQPELTICE